MMRMTMTMTRKIAVDPCSFLRTVSQLIETDTDEDEDKKPSSADKEPPQKKTKTEIKKTRKRKANPAKRRTKARINHGELEDRTDGSTWFRANENAPWGESKSLSWCTGSLLTSQQNQQSAMSLIAQP